MPRILVAYADLIDGIRSHYARTAGDNGTAAFSAVAAVVILFNLNVSLIIILIDFLADEKLNTTKSIHEHRALLLCAVVVVVIAHWFFAKKTRVYDRRGGARSLSWKRILRFYCIATACNFVGTMLLMVLKVPIG